MQRRLLEAVDIPELHHLTNVLVFPTCGTRPHPDEIGGGDLDGDRYFVTWDKVLTHFTPFHPMDYSSAAPKATLETLASNPVPQLVDYFLNSIFKANLGEISNCYLTFADQFGATSKTCLELAELHSRAVDAPKTGDFVQIPSGLRPRSTPHFMEKSTGVSYRSKGVLGQLYDRAKKKQSQLGSKKKDKTVVTLDDDLLLEGREEFATEARQLALQFEQEMMGTLSLSRSSSERNQAILHLTETYREKFHEKPLSFEKKLLKASAWYESAYNQAQVRIFMASFIDCAFDYLNQIKANAGQLAYSRNKANTPFLPISINPSLFQSAHVQNQSLPLETNSPDYFDNKLL